MSQPIYLDYNATTPVDERVMPKMVPYFRQHFGNASSKGHAYGWAAEEAAKQAREQVAALLGVDEPKHLVFTAGATEALNTALKGVAEAYQRKGRHLVTVATEHRAVLGACEALERNGYEVTYLPVDEHGLVDVNELQAAVTDETLLVAVMWANNETGVLQPIPEIADRVRARDALFLSDATQAAGKVPVDAAHADLLACSAHKFYGPKGVGALYASRRRPRVRLAPLIDGGGQEEGLRGGTLNTPGIVGMGAAAEVAREQLEADAERLRRMRDTFEATLLDALDDVQINGRAVPRLPQTSSITFYGVPNDKLTMRLRGLAVSTGSACSTASNRPSHVLAAMGLSTEAARATLRFSLGRFTTDDEMEQAADQVVNAVRALREKATAKSI